MNDPDLNPSVSPEPLPPFPRDRRMILLPETRGKAMDWLTLLNSAGIFPEMRRGRLRWQLLIEPEDAEKARQLLQDYLQDSKDWPPPWAVFDTSAPEDRPDAGTSSIAAAIILIFFFFITGPSVGQTHWFVHGSAQADLILSGQWYRTITALTLHGDLAHVLGNAVALAFLGSMVCSRTGQGIGWLMMILGGAIGNYLNALTYQQGHDSVGASTLLFTAVGLLAAVTIAEHRRLGAPWGWRVLVVPLLTVLAVFGLMGANPGTDITAHLYGAIGGLIVGILSPFTLRYRDHLGMQVLTGISAVGLVAVTWLVALY